MKTKGKKKSYKWGIKRIDRANKKTLQYFIGVYTRELGAIIHDAKRDGAKNLKIDIRIRY